MRNTFPVVVLAVLMTLVILRHWLDGPTRWRALGPALFALAFVTHAHAAVRGWESGSQRDTLEAQARALTFATFCSALVPDGEVLISNWAFLARIDCGQRVRHLELVNAGSDREARDQWADVSHAQTLVERLTTLPDRFPGQALRVAVAPGTLGVSDADLPLASATVGAMQRQGWRFKTHTALALVIARDGD